MQEWCLTTWGQEPGETWIKKNLAAALKEFEQSRVAL
jgi:hypothetical protein